MSSLWRNLKNEELIREHPEVDPKLVDFEYALLLVHSNSCVVVGVLELDVVVSFAALLVEYTGVDDWVS